MSSHDDLIGQCFRVQTCWGDDSPPWYIYRRVRRVMAGIAECHRFEVRSPQQAISGGDMLVLYPSDPIQIAILLKQERIEASVWNHWYVLWASTVTDPWNVE